MKNKIRGLFILIISIMVMGITNVYADTFPNDYVYGDYRYSINGFGLKVYQMELEKGEDNKYKLTDESANKYLNDEFVREIPLTASDITFNPEYKERTIDGKSTTVIELNTDMTKEKLVNLLQTEMSNTTTTNQYVAELVVYYDMTEGPADYSNYFAINGYKLLINTLMQSFGVETNNNIDPKTSLNTTNSQVINLIGITTSDDLTYETNVENSSNSLAYFNYFAFSTSENSDGIGKIIMFSNVEDIDYLIENLSTLSSTAEEDLNESKNDVTQAVAVPDTAQKKTKKPIIIGIILLVCGIITVLYVMTRKSMKENDEL